MLPRKQFVLRIVSYSLLCDFFSLVFCIKTSTEKEEKPSSDEILQGKDSNEDFTEP